MASSEIFKLRIEKTLVGVDPVLLGVSRLERELVVEERVEDLLLLCVKELLQLGDVLAKRLLVVDARLRVVATDHAFSLFLYAQWRLPRLE